MRILSRYLVREMIGPTFLGFLFYTFVILMRQLLDFAEMIIKRSLPFTTVLELLALSLPHIIVLTIPMSLLFGILIAIGRLSSDSEITAMRAAGVSTRQIYRPVLYVSFLVFILNLLLMNVVLPRGNHALQQLKARLFTASIQKEIKPRVFYDEYEDMVIYVDDVDASTGLWEGVFISLARDLATGESTGESGRQNVIVAEGGRLSESAPGPSRGSLWIELENVENHVFDPDAPDRYDLNRNAFQQMTPTDRFANHAGRFTASKSIREMDIIELFDELGPARRRDPLDHRIVLVEIHKKLSIPFACIAFGVIGLPLGITNRRGGRSSGFTISLAIILVYYIVLQNGEEYARAGIIPAGAAMWTPNLILIALGVFLIRRVNREMTRVRRGFLARARETLRQIRHRRTRLREETSEKERRSILNRIDIAFPNIIDRYILREFVKVLFLVLLSCIILFTVVDYTERADEISENRVPFDVVASYYRYFVIQISNLVLPLAVLIATLIVFGIFSRHNEITAVKANGVSLYRITLPVIALACLLSVGSYLVMDFVLPYSNQRLTELRNLIMGRETARTFTPEQRQWVFGRGRYLFNFLSYDARRRVLSQVQVFEFHPSEFRLTRRVWASEARFDGVGWVFVDGWIRSFADDGSASFTPIVNPIRLHYPEGPDYFEYEAKAPDQMTFQELRDYITNLRRSGYSSEPLLVDLWGKTSWPLVSLVMALIALPFAFQIRKRGALYGIGIALFLGFIYWGLFGVFTKLGEVGSLPAALAAWSANIIFSLAALYLFLRVET